MLALLNAGEFDCNFLRFLVLSGVDFFLKIKSSLRLFFLRYLCVLYHIGFLKQMAF